MWHALWPSTTWLNIEIEIFNNSIFYTVVWILQPTSHTIVCMCCPLILCCCCCRSLGWCSGCVVWPFHCGFSSSHYCFWHSCCPSWMKATAAPSPTTMPDPSTSCYAMMDLPPHKKSPPTVQDTITSDHTPLMDHGMQFQTLRSCVTNLVLIQNYSSHYLRALLTPIDQLQIFPPLISSLQG